MDPILILISFLVLVIGAYIWYKIDQNKREKEYQAKLEQLPEAEREVYIAQRENKKKWGCLSAFSALALLGNSIFAIFSFVNVGNPYAVFAGLISVLGAVFAGVIYWKHKRWAVFGYITIIVVTALINFASSQPAAALQGVIPILLLAVAVRPVWDQMD